jgi:hypothetical protein
MNCVRHIQHGMWTHPRDRSTEYNTICYRQHLARLAERSLRAKGTPRATLAVAALRGSGWEGAAA